MRRCQGLSTTLAGLDYHQRMLVDSHAHISTEKYDADRAQVLERAQKAGLVGIIDVGCDEASSRAAAALAEREPMVWAAVGVHPASGIVDYANEHPVDLIAIGTHGRRGLRRLVLGSVADKVLRSANVPILLVRDAKRKARPLEVVRGRATHASSAG